MATKTLTVACAAYTYRVGDETRVAVTGETIQVDNDDRTKDALEKGWLADPKAAPRAAAPATPPDTGGGASTGGDPTAATPPGGASTGDDTGGEERPAQNASVEKLLGWVGDDLDRARDVYDAELDRPKDDQRTTLVEPLESKLNS